MSLGTTITDLIKGSNAGPNLLVRFDGLQVDPDRAQRLDERVELVEQMRRRRALHVPLPAQIPPSIRVEKGGRGGEFLLEQFPIEAVIVVRAAQNLEESEHIGEVVARRLSRRDRGRRARKTLLLPPTGIVERADLVDAISRIDRIEEPPAPAGDLSELTGAVGRLVTDDTARPRLTSLITKLPPDKPQSDQRRRGGKDLSDRAALFQLGLGSDPNDCRGRNRACLSRGCPGETAHCHKRRCHHAKGEDSPLM
jgi:hypothetical protein